MSSNHKLIVGDHVHWKGGWGSDPEEEVDWDRVVGRDAIVDLNNGHWAWAFQISRIKYAN